MKKLLIAALTVAAAWSASAQEPKLKLKKDSIHMEIQFTLPDSLSFLGPVAPDYRSMKPVQIRPAVSMTSLIVIQGKDLPARVTVINNNTLVGPHFNISNGQSWNWSPFPDAHLDARTLSFPARR